MFIVSFNAKKGVYREFVHKGLTVHLDFYCDVLARETTSAGNDLNFGATKTVWTIITTRRVISPSRSLTFLAKNAMAKVPRPLYSSGLALCDFALFPKKNWSSNGVVLTPWTPFNKKSRRSSTTSRKKISIKCSKTGKRAETDAFIPTVTSSDDTKPKPMYDNKPFCTPSPGTFGCLVVLYFKQTNGHRPCVVLAPHPFLNTPLE